MRYLIDTNILIKLEPTAPEHLEPQAQDAARLVARLQNGGQRVLRHPAMDADLRRDRNRERHRLRSVLLQKYTELDQPPPASLLPPAVQVDVSEQGQVDNLMLAAVVGNAVDFLITEDRGLHHKALQAGVADRVLTIADAVAAVSALAGRSDRVHPYVDDLPLHALRDADPMWQGIDEDYPAFSSWLTRSKREGRRCLAVRFPQSERTAAVCILKEDDDEPHLGGRVLKLCTFKVANEFRGKRFGELLLNAVFTRIASRHIDHAWVTVFPSHQDLIALFETFGFELREARVNGELVYTKSFAGPAPVRCDAQNGAECLRVHISEGPPLLHLRPDHVFVVPVQPRYHRRLFPEAELEPELGIESDPVGNALRKAYLCHSSTRQIGIGDALLFYRSHAQQGVYAAGVVEDRVVTVDEIEILRLVGDRTVYSEREVAEMTQRAVLAILFRQDRVLSSPIHLNELIAAGALAGPPQQITRLRGEATAWLSTRLLDGSP